MSESSYILHIKQPEVQLSHRALILLGRIAAGEGRFNSNSEVNINTEVKSIPVTKKGVYFAFRDQGACISLLAIKVNIPAMSAL